MPLLVDEVKRWSTWREIEICIQRRKSFYKKNDHILIFKPFSVKNEGFEVLKSKKAHVLIFKDFFSEE